MRHRLLKLALLLVATSPSIALGCPPVGRFIDFNCDGLHKVAVVGDSVVYGIGDLLHNNTGGYVLRVDNKTPESEVVAYGVPGISTVQMRRKLASGLMKPHSEVYRKLIGSDLIIIDIGRNDFWIPFTPDETLTGIRRIVSLLRNRFGELGEVRPLIIVATPLPTTRGFQRSFIENVANELIEHNSEALPVELYFHTISEDIISVDGIHPDASGYTQIARYVRRWLINDSVPLSLALRPDNDADKIYDLFETPERFGTDPTLFDTDGDTFGDGTELFELGRNPLDPLG